MPVLSVVIPVYNKRNEVRRAVESVLGQSFSEIAVLVVDDGSTDGSLEVLSEISDSRLKTVSVTNGGEGMARNLGVEMAEGDLVAFLDGDDEWLPDFCKEMINLIRRFPQAGIYCSGVLVERAGGGRHRLPTSGLPSGWRSGIVPDYFRTRNVITASSVVIRRHVFLKAGGFRTGLPSGTDLDLWLRMAAYAEVAHLNEPLAVWHYEVAGSMSKVHRLGVPSRLRESLVTLDEDATVSRETVRSAREYVMIHEWNNVLLLWKRGFRQETMVSLARWRSDYGRTHSARYLFLKALTSLPTWTVGIARSLYLRGRVLIG